MKNTTVNLSFCVQSIKERLAPIYGLKSIISAGLVLLDRLSDSEQKKIIQEVNAPPSKEDVKTEIARLVCSLSFDEQAIVLQELCEAQKEISVAVNSSNKTSKQRARKQHSPDSP